MRTSKVVLFVFITVSVILLISWSLGWLSMPFQTTSVENVKKQWGFAYSYNESLKAIAQQVVNTQKLVDSTTDKNVKAQRESQLLAYENNYSRVKAEYDAKLKNAFEAKWIKPSDVPDSAPTLSQMIKQLE